MDKPNLLSICDEDSASTLPGTSWRKPTAPTYAEASELRPSFDDKTCPLKLPTFRGHGDDFCKLVQRALELGM